METVKILAMAVAAVAEESGVELKRVVVRSFRETKKNSLEQFIEDNHISYHKFQLEDLRA